MTLSEDRGMTGIPPTLAISVLPGVPPSIQTERLNKIDVYTTFAKVGGKVTKKLTIKEMREIAESRGGKCLTNVYFNARTHIEWECNNGHTWWARPDSIKQGSWCAHCEHNKIRNTIEAMQQRAISRGGKCLSIEYKNTKNKLKWQCGEGHTWETTPDKIKSGTWCPYCAKVVKLTIDEMHHIAGELGGKCNSKEYKDAKTKLEWQCKEGHKWKATPGSIKRGTWCRRCAYIEAGIQKRLSIKEMRELAIVRGGSCISIEYINSATKLRWQCSEGHEWNATQNNIKNGTWCPECAIAVTRLKIQDMHNLANARGGECLSTDYINSETNLRWRCSEQHEWVAPSHTINSGHWCPECASKNFVREKIVREIFQNIFDKPFPAQRHDFLINPETGYKLELDGYNREMSLAFEHQGAQHYIVKDNYIMNSAEKVASTKKRDVLKRKLCKKAGVTLIEVPFTVPKNQMVNYIIFNLKRAGFTITPSIDAYDIYMMIDKVHREKEAK